MDINSTRSRTVVETEISLEQELFEQAEAAAERMGLSRSALYAAALKEYLCRPKNEQLARDLNAAYGGGFDAEENWQLRVACVSFRRLRSEDE